MLKKLRNNKINIKKVLTGLVWDDIVLLVLEKGKTVNDSAKQTFEKKKLLKKSCWQVSTNLLK